MYFHILLTTKSLLHQGVKNESFWGSPWSFGWRVCYPMTTKVLDLVKVRKEKRVNVQLLSCIFSIFFELLLNDLKWSHISHEIPKEPNKRGCFNNFKVYLTQHFIKCCVQTHYISIAGNCYQQWLHHFYSLVQISICVCTGTFYNR